MPNDVKRWLHLFLKVMLTCDHFQSISSSFQNSVPLSRPLTTVPRVSGLTSEITPSPRDTTGTATWPPGGPGYWPETYRRVRSHCPECFLKATFNYLKEFQIIRKTLMSVLKLPFQFLTILQKLKKKKDTLYTTESRKCFLGGAQLI